MARPSKYKPEHCETLLQCMTEGLSFEASCAEIGIHRETGYQWAEKYPEFDEAKKLGEAKGQLFWERNAMNGGRFERVKIDGTEGYPKEEQTREVWRACNPTVWIFTMKNRFGWRDKKEIFGAGGSAFSILNNMTTQQVEEKIDELLARHGKGEK